MVEYSKGTWNLTGKDIWGIELNMKPLTPKGVIKQIKRHGYGDLPTIGSAVALQNGRIATSEDFEAYKERIMAKRY